MESIPALMHSAVARWRAWSLLQRTIFGFAAGVILCGTLSLSLQTEEIRYVPLSLGKQFSSDDLENLEQSLREKNLTTFRREGTQLLVPENEQTAYDAALLQSRKLPQDWASEWEQKFDATNPFTSSRKLHMLKEIALAKELKRIIQGLDGIEEANVVWAETETNSWPSRQRKVTASVNIRPEPGTTLSEQKIRAIQFSVANMVPNLEPQDVIVLDYASGRHYQLQPEQARFETDLQRWVDREVSRWQERLSHAIVHHWPDAQLLIRIRQEELKQAAWHLMQNSRTDRQIERTFRDVELELQHRFPEYLQLQVTLPNRAEQVLSGTDSKGVTVEEDVLAALLGWLPPSFDANQLSVKLESSPSDSVAKGVVQSENTTPSWQPVTMVGIAGVLLLLVSRRFQSSPPLSESDRNPVVENVEPMDHPSSAADVATPLPAMQSMTPLGDPELVADVLKQWLGSSHVESESGPSAQIPRESD